MARDCNGLIIMALKLAIFNQFMNCIIEGDAKTCIDACNGNPDECLWILSAICNDVRFLLHSVDSCVKLEEMQMLLLILWHNLLHTLGSSFCNVDSLPPFSPLAKKAWLTDVSRLV